MLEWSLSINVLDVSVGVRRPGAFLVWKVDNRKPGGVAYASRVADAAAGKKAGFCSTLLCSLCLVLDLFGVSDATTRAEFKPPLECRRVVGTFNR